MCKGFGGVPIYEVCGGMKSFDPKGSGETSLKKKGADNVVKRTKNTFGLAILRRGVRA